jgi:hypothetical protein
MSERMKDMSKKYGWTVVGIYLGLSAIDFPFCYLAVRWFGTERIAKVEHAIMDYFWATLDKVAPSLKERRETNEAVEAAEAATREADEAVAHKAKHEDASECRCNEIIVGVLANKIDQASGPNFSSHTASTNPSSSSGCPSPWPLLPRW